jgi:hypothetical protein
MTSVVGEPEAAAGRRRNCLPIQPILPSRRQPTRGAKAAFTG